MRTADIHELNICVKNKKENLLTLFKVHFREVLSPDQEDHIYVVLHILDCPYWSEKQKLNRTDIVNRMKLKIKWIKAIWKRGAVQGNQWGFGGKTLAAVPCKFQRVYHTRLVQ